MNAHLKNKLTEIAKRKIINTDVSHDFEHTLRVLANAEKIAVQENADIDIIVPAALFHDIVNYPKNDRRAKYSTNESSEATRKILKKIPEFPKKKIEMVCVAIRSCSFSKGETPKLLEAQILQDADGLEATGAISIMRTFASTGQMKRQFYDKKDPFCTSRQPNDLKYALDLFYTRLLKIADKMHTKKAKKIAKRRTRFLKNFLKELDIELKES